MISGGDIGLRRNAIQVDARSTQRVENTIDRVQRTPRFESKIGFPNLFAVRAALVRLPRSAPVFVHPEDAAMVSARSET